MGAIGSLFGLPKITLSRLLDCEKVGSMSLVMPVFDQLFNPFQGSSFNLECKQTQREFEYRYQFQIFCFSGYLIFSLAIRLVAKIFIVILA